MLFCCLPGSSFVVTVRHDRLWIEIITTSQANETCLLFLTIRLRHDEKNNQMRPFQTRKRSGVIYLIPGLFQKKRRSIKESTTSNNQNKTHTYLALIISLSWSKEQSNIVIHSSCSSFLLIYPMQ